MTDPILDDVKTLLEKEKGDKRILEQIQRAAENNEVISNFERNYVAKLAEQHLEKTPLENISAPDVELPKEEPIPQTPEIEAPQEKPVRVETIQYQKPAISKPVSKNTKIFAGIGAAVAIIIIAAAVSMSGMSTPTDVSPSPVDTSSDSAFLQTDISSYDKGDIISISGKSDSTLGNTIKLSIKNSAGNIVWAEELNVKNDGRYSTLTFAGGFGWDSAGTYTLTAEHGSESESKTFSYNG